MVASPQTVRNKLIPLILALTLVMNLLTILSDLPAHAATPGVIETSGPLESLPVRQRPATHRADSPTRESLSPISDRSYSVERLTSRPEISVNTKLSTLSLPVVGGKHAAWDAGLPQH